MSNPDAFANSQAPLPDLHAEEFSEGSLADEAEQADAQDDEAQEAALPLTEPPVGTPEGVNPGGAGS